jgi:hypothetical protein
MLEAYSRSWSSARDSLSVEVLSRKVGMTCIKRRAETLAPRRNQPPPTTTDDRTCGLTEG